MRETGDEMFNRFCTSISLFSILETNTGSKSAIEIQEKACEIYSKLTKKTPERPH